MSKVHKHNPYLYIRNFNLNFIYGIVRIIDASIASQK